MTTSVIEVTADTGDGRHHRSLWANFGAATTAGLAEAMGWLRAELGDAPELTLRTTNKRSWVWGDGTDDGPTVEAAEWHVHHGDPWPDE